MTRLEARALIREADRIARERVGMALTIGEVRLLKAVAFLREIAPHLFEDEKTETVG